MIKRLTVKALVYLVALVLAAVLLDQLITHLPGYVLIAISQTTVEMNLWFAIAAVVVLVVGGYWGLRWLRWLWRLLLPLIGRRSPENYTRLTERGLLAYLRGDHEQAQRWLLRSAKRSPMPLVNLLAAADSAHTLGDVDQALAFLDRAKEHFGEQDVTLALARAEIYRRAGRQQERLQTLLATVKRHPHDALVRDRLCDAHIALGHWESVRELLPGLRRRLPRERWLELQGQLVVAHLHQLGSSLSSHHHDGDKQKLQMFWLEQSAQVQQQPEVLLAYCQQLLALQEGVEVEALVRKYLRHHWHSELVIFYGLLATVEPAKQLRAAEHWLTQHPDDWALLLSLGRICLRNHLWGRALEYFETSAKVSPSRIAYAEMARLLAHMGEHHKSSRVYQHVVQMDTPALPELPMP
ncbi:heme biosynthesis protein HemY [Halioxenophilus sp. WMMB6]|uniref:heme biosynthesis protein HemY n=1 Tax=Halioxenophilus sp. WMMB6 TaxID=3073815 RepID=UPI00295E7A9C|nr:heme biosynthesis HemY N-terminal domain-containing protein [Halioxenophilus sp. WMMB6]